MQVSRSTKTWAGLISLIQGLLIFIPTIVLGQAIDWPASLDDPASIALPRLLEEESAVRLGYFAYLVYSILFVVAVFMLTRLSTGKAMAVFGTIIIAVAAISTLARTIGIVRWLAPMPQLADSWQQATSDPERFSISVVFDALNSYGGTVGEVLGVSIFAAISVFILCVALMRDGSLPKWLGAFGIISALVLVSTAGELIGFVPGDLLVFLGTTFIQLWFLTVGLWLLIWGRRQSASSGQTVINR